MVNSKHSLTLGVLSLILPLAMASAQNNSRQSNTGLLEEIVVTAQKRSENLSDVPISVSAVAGEKLEQAGIAKLEDLQLYVPNLHMTESGISTQMYIRGIGTGNNQGFEQSVGQYIDGVYYGRQQLIRAPFLDLAQVEVLRGPQSILFGKNSIAGALNLVTAKPTEQFEASISGRMEEHGIQEYQLIGSGPLTDTLNGRLALRHYREDGYVRNSFKGVDEPERDETAARLTLHWLPNDQLDILFKLEHDTFDAEGRQIEIIQDDPALAGPLAGLNYSQILGVLGHPGAITDNILNFNRQANANEFSNNELDNFTVTANYGWDDYTLTSVTSWVSYEFTELCDCDYNAAPIIDVILDEEYDQFSQELRIASTPGGNWDWIGGVFFQTGDLDFRDEIRIPGNSVLGLLSGGALASILETTVDRDYTADSDLAALFAQATWHLSDTLRLTMGGRYTWEEKSASRVINILDQATGAVTSNPVAPIIFDNVFLIENEQTSGHNLLGERDETSFTPLVNVQWDVNPDTMLYASVSTGFKAGGYDARANNIRSFEFEEEEVTAFEVGAKSRLADGRADIGVALYYTDYDDLQISQFDGTLGFNVGNAAKVRAQGIEVDGRWLLTDGLTLGYAVAYLDHEFRDFRNGNCYNRQVPDGDVVEGIPLCDYTGKSGQYTPDLTSNISLNYIRPLNGNIDWHIGGDMSYASEQNAHVNLDPQYEIDSYYKFNLRLGLVSDRWEAYLGIDNATDEEVLSYVNNAPLSGSTFGTNTFYGFVTRPRTSYIRLRYAF